MMLNDFFGSIYKWFINLYGQDLDYYLWGYSPVTESYTNPNIYNHVGLVTLGITIVLVFIFYYVLNHPRYCKWWTWLLTLILNSVIALFVGFSMIYSKYINGLIPQELMYQIDEDGDVAAGLISGVNCWGFGMANMIVAAMFFSVLTFILKWWSKAAKYVPF